MKTVKLTTSQALVRYLANQFIEVDGETVPYFAGVWAIFGHGNVAGLGEALYQHRDELPSFRAHNEQGMAHAAIAFAKANFRRRAMACTTSIGPGATNLITAAALAHVNRLPVLFLPGDIFASRRPDPVLQQIEDVEDGTVSANDCFRPVSRYFDRITRPSQILAALPRTMAVFTDPASCGPVCLSICQDVQSEAFDFSEAFFEPKTWRIRAPEPDAQELDALVDALQSAKRPLMVAGGGVLYSGASDALTQFAERCAIPVVETQAGKSALPSSHPMNLGAVGVTGTESANAAATEADLIIGIGTRLQDFTTGSRKLFTDDRRKVFQVNVGAYDATKHSATAVVGDARKVLERLDATITDLDLDTAWTERNAERVRDWTASVDEAFRDKGTNLPSYAEIVGAVDSASDDSGVVLCAAGTLPGELHKLWRPEQPGGYHMEYGYSCMGYEIAGGIGAKMAMPDREIFVMVGDGSYLMLNSEIATSVMMGVKLTIILLDSGGFSCIDRLQRSTGSESFNNQLEDSWHTEMPTIDFAAHARSLGAISETVSTISELKAALFRAKSAPKTVLISMKVDPDGATDLGGFWWDVAVPEVSPSEKVQSAFEDYARTVRSPAKDS